MAGFSIEMSAATGSKLRHAASAGAQLVAIFKGFFARRQNLSRYAAPGPHLA
jgi:hypothetical protein